MHRKTETEDVNEVEKHKENEMKKEKWEECFDPALCMPTIPAFCIRICFCISHRTLELLFPPGENCKMDVPNYCMASLSCLVVWCAESNSILGIK